jgi:hypothetical protein
MTGFRKMIRWIGPALTLGGLVGITAMAMWKRPPEREPIVDCEKFRFSVRDDEQLAELRQVMHRSAIENGADFTDPSPTFFVDTTVRFQDAIRFSLRSSHRRHNDPYQLTLIRQGGGGVRMPGIRSDHCSYDKSIQAFTRLREQILQRWPQPPQ